MKSIEEHQGAPKNVGKHWKALESIEEWQTHSFAANRSLQIVRPTVVRGGPYWSILVETSSEVARGQSLRLEDLRLEDSNWPGNMATQLFDGPSQLYEWSEY